MLLHVLRIAHPALADALNTDLVRLATPPTGSQTTHVSLIHKRAVLTAIARKKSGSTISSPHSRPDKVEWLEVLDLAVGGLSAIRMTG